MSGTGFNIEAIKRAVLAAGETQREVNRILGEAKKGETPEEVARQEEFRREVAALGGPGDRIRAGSRRATGGHVTPFAESLAALVEGDYGDDALEVTASSLAAGPAPEEPNRWPAAAVLRVMPPTPVYDHKSMRESGRPKPHIINPRTLARTLCGKDFAFWRVVSDPIGDFDYMDFSVIGCANCVKAALKLMAGPEEDDNAEG